MGAAIVTGGIGRVICGVWRPDESVNRNRTPAMMTFDEPFALTVTPNATLNGATDGQIGLFVGCANAVDDAAATATNDPPTKLGCVHSERASLSLHDEVRKAAATRATACK
jgi:hypothetical protein